MGIIAHLSVNGMPDYDRLTDGVGIIGGSDGDRLRLVPVSHSEHQVRRIWIYGDSVTAFHHIDLDWTSCGLSCQYYRIHDVSPLFDYGDRGLADPYVTIIVKSGHHYIGETDGGIGVVIGGIRSAPPVGN